MAILARELQHTNGVRARAWKLEVLTKPCSGERRFKPHPRALTSVADSAWTSALVGNGRFSTGVSTSQCEARSFSARENSTCIGELYARRGDSTSGPKLGRELKPKEIVTSSSTTILALYVVAFCFLGESFFVLTLLGFWLVLLIGRLS